MPLISVLLAKWSISGVPRMRINLVHCIAQAGYRVDLVLFVGSLPEVERNALPDNVRVIEFGKERVGAALPRLVSYFRTNRPVAVIAAETHLNLSAILALQISRIKAQVSVSTHVPPTLAASRPLWHKARLVHVLAHFLYSRADAVVAISAGMADTLSESLRFPRESIHVIHNPVVNDALFEKARLSPGDLFHTIDVPIVLGVGRLRSSKGFLDLIDAFAKLSAQRDVHLVILGEGSQRPKLEARVRELGLDNVSLPGAVSNPFAWMARAQLFVSASHFEGLSNVMIEALACGCPVVATDCPTGPSEILSDGRYGELVAMKDTDALAGAMARTLDAPLDENTLRARAMDFHAERILNKYLSVLGLPDRGGAAAAKKPSV